MSNPPPPLLPGALRSDVRPDDAAAVREVVASTGFFHNFEIDVAVELVQERLGQGLASGYHFVFADDPHTQMAVGYACFGQIPCTAGSFDLYWIAVHDRWRGRGLGTRLMSEAERAMAAGVPDESGRGLAVARRVYVETSSTLRYEPTRQFYVRCGYAQEARLQNFYAEGDDKLVLVKVLNPR